MKLLQNLFDSIKPHVEKGAKYEKLHTLYEGHRTIFFKPSLTTGPTGVQVKDAADLKRVMFTVIVALIPCLLFGMWNVGHQHFLATGVVDATFISKFLLGAGQVLPILIVSYGVGLGVEFTFCVIRNHPIEEGFLVTGILIPLVMPATIPLWQVAMATVFGVFIAKEVFGGTGMNILNVALTSRAFLYFAYPSQIAGDMVWTYLGDQVAVDGFSGATLLSYGAAAAANGTEMMAGLGGHWYAGMFDFWNLFLGVIPGSIGETSVLMCLIGATILVLTGVGSWKIILSVFGGAWVMGMIYNLAGTNSFMLMPAHYHLVVGGLAFGAVFMATDPVSAAQTETGKWIYGFMIGVLTVIIRISNPAYPEGIMLAILFMNVFAPLIDYYVVEAHKKRRLKRATI
ncbi:MAG: NADH:ubiquinone reductase (Na(+)-transporting) subunit B [Flammeovirgaceae bacterium TMED32]|nr:MAG: NADH:ubiquinone reductase (Na(+)-transporting) subunit B [Flammeovirgaceae bacterium TMED32]